MLCTIPHSSASQNEFHIKSQTASISINKHAHHIIHHKVSFTICHNLHLAATTPRRGMHLCQQQKSWRAQHWWLAKATLHQLYFWWRVDEHTILVISADYTSQIVPLMKRWQARSVDQWSGAGFTSTTLRTFDDRHIFIVAKCWSGGHTSPMMPTMAGRLQCWQMIEPGHVMV